MFRQTGTISFMKTIQVEGLNSTYSSVTDMDLSYSPVDYLHQQQF